MSSKDQRTRSFSSSASRSPKRNPRSKFSDSEEDDQPPKRPILSDPSTLDRSRTTKRRQKSKSLERPRDSKPIKRSSRKQYSRSRSRSSSGSSASSRSRSRSGSRSYSRSRSRSPPSNRRRSGGSGGSRRQRGRGDSRARKRKRRSRSSHTSRRSYSRSLSGSPNFNRQSSSKRRRPHGHRSGHQQHDNRRGSRSPRREGGGDEKLHRGPMLSYKQFLLHQLDDVSPQRAQKLYDQYQKEYKMSKNRIFFERHKDEEWFQEKYNPLVRSERRKKQIEDARIAAKLFHEKYGKGLLTLDEDLKFVTEQEQDEAGEIDEKDKDDKLIDSDDEDHQNENDKDHEMNGTADNPSAEIGGNIDDDDENSIDGDGDKRSRSRSTEKTKQPTTNDDGDDQSESDIEVDETKTTIPQQSNNAKDNVIVIDDDDDDDDTERDTKAGVLTISGLTSFSTKSFLAGDFGRENEQKKENCEENAVFVQQIPLKCTRKMLFVIFSKLPGFEKIVISEPLIRQNFNRYGWVSYETQDQCQDALKLNGTKITMDSDGLHFFLHVRPKRKSNRPLLFAHTISLTKKRISIDLTNALLLTKLLDKEKGIDDIFDDKYLLDGIPTEICRLNFLFLYLRNVHFFCFYCTRDFYDEEGLMGKCGKIHPRDKKGVIESQEAKTFVEKMDKRVSDRISFHPDDGVLTWKEITIHKFQETNTKFIQKGRHRCGLCAKLFRGPEFIHKHITIKHAPQIEEHLTETVAGEYFENYQNDEEKISMDNFHPIPGGGHDGMEHISSPMEMNSYGPRGGFGMNAPPGMPPLLGNRPPGMNGGPPFFNDRPPPFGGPRQFHPAMGGMGRRPFPPDFGRGGPPPGMFRRRIYNDLDRPQEDGEEEIDYGFGDSRPNFHL